MSLFVTGTDTGVGKTYTVIQLLRLLRATGTSCAGMKPICCGDRRDAELLLAAGNGGLKIDEVNPIWLKTPAAPIVGSSVENVAIDVKQILAAFLGLQDRVEHVIVEGVGGWLVPLRSDYFVSDLAVEMGLPVLIVAQNRLGCLSHTALTLQSVLQHNLRCVGVTLVDVPGTDISNLASSTNANVLRKILNVPLFDGLGESLTELPVDWRLMTDSIRRA